MTQTSSTLSALDEWQQNIAPGDVVSFRFPHETQGSAEPKVRPALVLEVEDLDGMRSVTLAYGSSQRPRKPRRDHVVTVSHSAERKAICLPSRTYFNAARRVTVSVRHPSFDVSAASGTAVLGRLTGWSLAELNRVRERLREGIGRRRQHLRGLRKAPGRTISVVRRKNGRILGQELRHV